jgi:preprotein translocase subunit YajC
MEERMDFLVNVAYAAEALAQDGAASPPGGILASPLFILIPMFAIFYFLLIRPQQKKQKEHREMLNKLQKGDVVVTQGGLQGKITGLTDQVATVEIAEKVRVKIQRGYIVGVVSKGEAVEE